MKFWSIGVRKTAKTRPHGEICEQACAKLWRIQRPKSAEMAPKLLGHLVDVPPSIRRDLLSIYLKVEKVANEGKVKVANA